MPSKSVDYQAKELSIATWPDLEKLFRKPGVGDAWWCWCTFHHDTPRYTGHAKTRAEISLKNHQRQKVMIRKGESHGIIVYTSKGEPVGWVQYGISEELPHMDHNRNYRKLGLGKNVEERLWRITCFTVDKEYRGKAIATLALNSAVEAIRKKGGGLVEAFPVSETDQGPGYMYTGRVSTFERAGFKIVGQLATGRTCTVLMRKRV